MSAIACAPARLETPRKLTLDEAKDTAAVIAMAGDCTPHDDLMALAQFVDLLDADPVQALEDERREHANTAHRTHLERAVLAAAIELTDAKLAAEKTFRTGIADMARLVDTNPALRQLADRMSAAGVRLQRAVDAYRRAS